MFVLKSESKRIMDKQQATQHILDRLRSSYSADEITNELSRMLNAPPEVTRRFVDQVISQHPEAVPAPPPDDIEIPDWMQSISIESPINSDPVQAVEPLDQSIYSDLPPNLQTLLDGNDSYVAPSLTEPDHEPADSAGIDLPLQAKFIPPNERNDNAKNGDESQAIDLEELSDYVLDQLKKQRRHNDIVETVCDRTGWHWNKSQRFVARVKTKNYEQLQSGQNRVIILVGIGIILAGLVMALNGASTIYEYAKIVTFAKTNPEALLDTSPQPIIFALAATFTGLGMIVGGGFGVGRAMTNS
jgi:hypothetical protein